MVAAVSHETLFTAEDFVQPTMPLELLQIGPNVRTDPGDLEDLAASIREFGVLQPVKVQSTAAGWVVLWGQRRVLASRLAGLTEIPVIIAPPAAADLAGLTFEQLVENLQRADLNDIDEAKALRAILDAHPGMTHDTVADKLGMSRPWVSNSLRLLGLDEAVQAKVAGGELSGTHARAIASLPPKQQALIATRIVKDKIPSRQIESELSWRAQEAANDEAKAKRTAKWIPKAIALLTAEKVPFAVEVQISAGNYNFDVPAIEKAVKAAGWKKITNRYYSERPKDGKCDCTAIRLDMNGRAPSLVPVCTDDRHTDRDRNIRQLASRAEQEARKRDLARVTVVVAARLDALAPPITRMLAVVLSRQVGRYLTWAQANEVPDDELSKLVAEQLCHEWILRDVDLEELITELAGPAVETPAPAVKPVKAKKAAG